MDYTVGPEPSYYIITSGVISYNPLYMAEKPKITGFHWTYFTGLQVESCQGPYLNLAGDEWGTLVAGHISTSKGW